MNMQHIGPNGKPVSWKEIEGIKNKVLKHNQAPANVFRVSEDWGETEEGRSRATLQENSTDKHSNTLTIIIS